jgi:pyruvate dehydrogenase E1 component alpha subunit
MSSDTLNLYRTMRTIRAFEEAVVRLVHENAIPGTTHEYVGQEAVAAGVCAALKHDDIITSTHRGHGHVIAKGADVRRMMAELMGKDRGLNRGRGGSMHVADLSLGIYGANGIVAGGVPFALGGAWAARAEGRNCVAVAFFGDGAIGQGLLSECLNLAALWSLPVVFVCENNGYAVSLSVARSVAGSIPARATACDIPAETVDGMDALAVLEAANRAVEHARRGRGPFFLECITYRYAGHHTAEAVLKLKYRSEDEIEQWRKRDPLLLAENWLSEEEREHVDAEVDALIEEAIAYGRESAPPATESALDFMYRDPSMRPRTTVG